MEGKDRPSPAPPETQAVETRGARLRRHGHRTWLYTWAFLLVALVVVLIALILANTRQVELSWVFGDGHASLVWIILAAAVLGWLLGIATSVLFRFRTRRRA
ncbi:MAG: LapA family protein [Gaiellaceae bacterium]